MGCKTWPQHCCQPIHNLQNCANSTHKRFYAVFLLEDYQRSHVTRYKTFITHLANLACFNAVHSDDDNALGSLMHEPLYHPRAHALKHLNLARCVINITYTKALSMQHNCINKGNDIFKSLLLTLCGTSDNGHSEEWTTSLQWTHFSPPTCILSIPPKKAQYLKNEQMLVATQRFHY